MLTRLILYLTFLYSLSACNGDKTKESEKAKTDSSTTKKKSGKNTPPIVAAKKPPIINITDSVSVKRIVVCIKDSAANYDRIAAKLANIYGAKLAEVFKKEKLKPMGSPMAWFKNHKAPYFFEAGIPVNKKPSKLPKGVFVRETRADSVILVHFFGPYDLIPQGYDAVKEWMKENGRTARGTSYEIYITNPIDKKGKPVDPYKIQTDLVFPFH